MKKKILAIPIIMILIMVLCGFIVINISFNRDMTTFTNSYRKNTELINSKFGNSAQKFYSDKSIIKLYNRQGVIFIDLNNNLYKIDLTDIKNKIKNMF